MKPFSLFFVFIIVAVLFGQVNVLKAQIIPVEKAVGIVNDFAGVINRDDSKVISDFAQELQDKTTAQLAVATVQTTGLEDIASYSIHVFDKWKIGQKGKNNGVLILVAVNDHKAWITTGYGLEGALPDVICSKIVRLIMIPYFKSGEYSAGIREGAKKVIDLVSSEYHVKVNGLGQVKNFASNDNLSIIILLFVIFIVILSIMRPSRYSQGGGFYYSGGYPGGGFSSGSFGGGGFGGFGGGSSGGGGGGGSW